MVPKKVKRKGFFGVLLALLLLVSAVLAVGQAHKPKYHYDTRTDLSIHFSNADAVIESLRNALKRHDWRITIRYNAKGDNMADIQTLVKELMTYALAETDDPAEGDYLRHQWGGYDLTYRYSVEGNHNAYELVIVPTYYTKPQQEAQVDEEVQRLLREFAFDRNTSDVDKVRTIYDYVYNTVNYDRIHKKNDHYHLKTTAYAALFHRQAVCQGYCVLMYRLLREAGVDCRIVTGMATNDAGEEYHSWNLVGIDGVYYNLDVTWDKQTESHDWFLKCDESFSDHVRSEEYATGEFYERYPMAEGDFNDE